MSDLYKCLIFPSSGFFVYCSFSSTCGAVCRLSARKRGDDNGNSVCSRSLLVSSLHCKALEVVEARAANKRHLPIMVNWYAFNTHVIVN